MKKELPLNPGGGGGGQETLLQGDEGKFARRRANGTAALLLVDN